MRPVEGKRKEEEDRKIYCGFKEMEIMGRKNNIKEDQNINKGEEE